MVVSTLITSTSVVTYRTSCTTPFSCNEYVDCCPYLVELSGSSPSNTWCFGR